MKLRLFAAIFALTPIAARAQDAPVKLYYGFGGPAANAWLVDAVMHKVLEQPGLVLEPKATPATLMVTIRGPIERDRGDMPKGFRFTLGFTRGGDPVGESWEDCSSDKMADCIAQVADDIRSADAVRR